MTEEAETPIKTPSAPGHVLEEESCSSIKCPPLRRWEASSPVKTPKRQRLMINRELFNTLLL